MILGIHAYFVHLPSVKDTLCFFFLSWSKIKTKFEFGSNPTTSGCFPPLLLTISYSSLGDKLPTGVFRIFMPP